MGANTVHAASGAVRAASRSAADRAIGLDRAASGTLRRARSRLDTLASAVQGSPAPPSLPPLAFWGSARPKEAPAPRGWEASREPLPPILPFADGEGDEDDDDDEGSSGASSAAEECLFWM